MRIELWILIFILILIIIVLILIFISFTRLARSQAAIFDDIDADNAFNWGSFAALSAIISLALAIISLILYWYDKIYSALIHVVTFFAFFTALLSAIFCFLSQSSISTIDEADDDVLSATSPMFWAAIISAIAAILSLIVFVLSFVYKPKVIVVV